MANKTAKTTKPKTTKPKTRSQKSKVAQTATKKKTVSKSATPVVKKAQKVSYRNSASRPAGFGVTQSKFGLLTLSVAWAFLGYGFASWAIDSGSLWHYLFTFISIYFFIGYAQKFIKMQFGSK